MEKLDYNFYVPSLSFRNNEKRKIKNALSYSLHSGLTEGSNWVIISADWFSRWKAFVDFDLNDLSESYQTKSDEVFYTFHLNYHCFKSIFVGIKINSSWAN
jgi:hypothetical protein